MNWLVGCLVDWLPCWFLGWLICSLIGWFVDSLVDWLIGRSADCGCLLRWFGAWLLNWHLMEKKQILIILVWSLGFHAKCKYFDFWWCSSGGSSRCICIYIYIYILKWVHPASLVSPRVPFIIFSPPQRRNSMKASYLVVVLMWPLAFLWCSHFDTVGWLVDWVHNELIPWFIGWLVRSLIGWLIGGLARCLAD